MKMHKRKNVLHIMHNGCIIMQRVGVGWGTQEQPAYIEVVRARSRSMKTQRY